MAAPTVTAEPSVFSGVVGVGATFQSSLTYTFTPNDDGSVTSKVDTVFLGNADGTDMPEEIKYEVSACIERDESLGLPW